MVQGKEGTEKEYRINSKINGETITRDIGSTDKEFSCVKSEVFVAANINVPTIPRKKISMLNS